MCGKRFETKDTKIEIIKKIAAVKIKYTVGVINWEEYDPPQTTV